MSSRKPLLFFGGREEVTGTLVDPGDGATGLGAHQREMYRLDIFLLYLSFHQCLVWSQSSWTLDLTKCIDTSLHRDRFALLQYVTLADSSIWHEILVPWSGNRTPKTQKGQYLEFENGMKYGRCIQKHYTFITSLIPRYIVVVDLPGSKRSIILPTYGFTRLLVGYLEVGYLEFRTCGFNFWI